jgi:hypothetical protein
VNTLGAQEQAIVATAAGAGGPGGPAGRARAGARQGTNEIQRGAIAAQLVRRGGPEPS